MAPRIIIGIVALVCSSICGMLMSFANFEILDRVNEKLPKEEQFALLGWHFSRSLGLWREYKRLYPEGRLLSKIRLLTALSVAGFLIVVWGFGILA